MLKHKTKWKSRFALPVVTLLGGAIIGLAGCGSQNEGGDAASPAGGASSSAGTEIKAIRIGYLPNIVMPQPLLGIANNEYAKLVPGVTFSGKDYPAGPEVLEALRAGTIDIAYTGPYPPLKAFVKSKDVVLLAGAGSGGTQIMVKKDSPIKTIKDLKGKIVGINQFGSTVDAMVRHAIAEGGLNPEKDVRIVEIKPAEQAEALKRGEAAAVAAPAPWPIVVQLQGEGRALLDWKQILDDGNYLQGVAFTTKKFAEANPQTVKQFVAAHRAITDRLKKQPDNGQAEVVAAWSKITKKKMEPEVAKAAFQTIEFTNEADQKGFERAQEIAANVGIIKEKSDLTGFIYAEK